MIDQSLIAWILSAAVGLFAFYYFLAKQTERNFRRAILQPRNDAVQSISSTNGDCTSGNVDVIIVGAGVAGSALAYSLAKDGRRIHVIERDLTEPDRIAGECLQPGGYLKLIELGLEDCLEEIDAQRVYGYALYKDGKHIRMPYPLEEFSDDVSGRSFHNGRFIQSMRRRVASLSNVKLEQGTVTSLLKETGVIKGVRYKTKAGEESTAFAPLTIVCDGCLSNLRRRLSNSKVDILSVMVGLVLENCQLPCENYALFTIAIPSSVALFPISSTEIRCVIDIPGQKVPSVSNGDMATYLKTLVAPHIPQEIRGSFLAAVDKGNIKTMPNRSMPAAPNSTPGALLLGDAFNIRHPLTAGGMTVALSDVVVLRDLLRPIHNLNDAPTVCKYLEAFYTLRKPMAFCINVPACGLYKVFCASPDQARIAQACFDFAGLGSFSTSGAMSVLGGLNPSPLSLVLCGVGVGIYIVAHLCLPFPSPKRIWIGLRLIFVTIGILFPIIKTEGLRKTFFPAIVPAYDRALRVN